MVYNCDSLSVKVRQMSWHSTVVTMSRESNALAARERERERTLHNHVEIERYERKRFSTLKTMCGMKRVPV